MSKTPQGFEPFIGRDLLKVEIEVMTECKKHGYSWNILDDSMPHNVDAEPKRLNTLVDDHGVIKKIFLG